MTRPRKSQADHDRMVREAARFLEEKGYRDIRADHEGFPVPEAIVWRKTGQGKVPDLTAMGSSFVVVEVETEDTIEDPQAATEWKLFAEHARENHGEFFLVVPEGHLAEGWRRLKLLGIEGNVWEI